MAGIVYEIYDPATGKALFHRKQVGNTISATVSGDINEANGWRRVRMPKAEWDAHERQGLGDLANLKAFWTAE